MKLSRHDFFSVSQHQLPFSILRRTPQVNYPLHEHEFVELVVVTGGTGIHFTERLSYKLEIGDVYIVNPGVRHGYKDVDNLTLINVLYNPESLMTHLADIGTMPGFHALFKIEPHFSSQDTSRLLLTRSQLEKAISIINRIEDEMGDNAPGFIFFSKVYFLELIGHLARSYNTAEAHKSPEVMRVAEAISHIELHFTEEISQEELAQIANLSKSHFLHIFKKTTSTTPLHYQKVLRIEKACSLLNQTELSINEIGYMCGYSDSNYFTRQFKSVMHVSPKNYRNKINQVDMPEPK